jgi:AcrR family transcriptional regulator
VFIFRLTTTVPALYHLNMFNTAASGTPRSAKSLGETTKEVIFEQALELFRTRGFEATTMRDIARAAKVATGAAYYYFQSKEAIVMAYYDQVQNRHGARVREELSVKQGLRARLGIVMHSKLEILKNDRKFLGALFRYTGEPGHPLSVFGKGTAEQRKQSVEIFREAIGSTEMSEEGKQLLPWAMWLAHLGMLLFFIHDESEGQLKTHTLVDGLLDVVAGLAEFTNSALVRPLARPFQTRMLTLLKEVERGELKF